MFADASKDVFGACAYIRWQIENGELDFRFIAGKSRVARLELQSAAIASRLGKE